MKKDLVAALAGVGISGCVVQQALVRCVNDLPACMQYYELGGVKEKLAKQPCWYLVIVAEEYWKEGQFVLAGVYLDAAVEKNPDDNEDPLGLGGCYPVVARSRLMYEMVDADEQTWNGVRDARFFQRMYAEYARVWEYLKKSKRGDKELEERVRTRMQMRALEERWARERASQGLLR